MFIPLSDSDILAQRVDFVFYWVLLLSIASFLTSEAFWLIMKLKGRGSKEIEKKHFEVAWSFIPLIILLSLTFVQTQFFSPSRLKRIAPLNSEDARPIINPETKKVREDLSPGLQIKKMNPTVRM